MAEISEVLIGAARLAATLFGFALMLIGFVSAAAFVSGKVWRESRVRVFAVIPVGKGKNELDTDICAAKSALEHTGAKGELLLLDVGADDETRRFCERRFGELITVRELGTRVHDLVCGNPRNTKGKER